MAEEKSSRSVLIRNVDYRAYAELSALAKKLGTSVGSLASQAFKLLVGLVDAGPMLAGLPADTPALLSGLLPVGRLKRKPVFVRHVSRLVVSREDLEKAPGPIFFFGVGELVFDPSVDTKLFEEKVLRIVDCGKVVIHRGLDKLAVLERALFIGEVEEKV
uniref:Uncharacterized protein n=1 Tax=Thermofilum pendens TaxID=2269 RepID=A0A7C3WKQ2_THEPE